MRVDLPRAIFLRMGRRATIIGASGDLGSKHFCTGQTIAAPTQNRIQFRSQLYPKEKIVENEFRHEASPRRSVNYLSLFIKKAF